MNDNCTFCQIIAGQRHGALVYEDARVVAFLDINQAAPGHTLIAPREHVPYWWELPDADAAAIATAAKPILRALRRVFDPAGVKLEQRNGRAAGQEIFHVHLHLIPTGRGSARLGRAALDERAAEIRAALEGAG